MTLCLLATANAQSSKTMLYSMTDLHILESEKNYTEFFAHAQDIRPSKRDELWEQMVVSMAEGYSEHVLKSVKITKKQIIELNKLLAWPTLKSSEFFIKNRMSVIIKQANNVCSSTTPDKKFCSDLYHYWKMAPGTAQQALIMYRVAYPFVQDIEFRYQILTRVIKRDIGKFYCGKSEWSDEILKLLQQLSVNNQSLKGRLSKSCWDSLTPALRKNLYSPVVKERFFAFSLLHEIKSLTTADYDYYHVTYLLDNPSRGELFNRAWTSLISLSNSHKRRESVLARLRQMDPLPDSIFGSLDTKKSEILTRTLSKYFPEYVDYYAKTCLEFLEGKRDFPNGNPTIQCRNLFERSNGKSLISSQLEKRFTRGNF